MNADGYTMNASECRNAHVSSASWRVCHAYAYASPVIQHEDLDVSRASLPDLNLGHRHSSGVLACPLAECNPQIRPVDWADV